MSAIFGFIKKNDDNWDDLITFQWVDDDSQLWRQEFTRSKDSKKWYKLRGKVYGMNERNKAVEDTDNLSRNPSWDYLPEIENIDKIA